MKPTNVLGRLPWSRAAMGAGPRSAAHRPERRRHSRGSAASPLHLHGDRRELGDAKFDQRVLEAGKLSAAEFAQPLRTLPGPTAPHRCRPDCRPRDGSSRPLFPRWAMARGRSFALRIFLRDGVGVVGQIDPGIIRTHPTSDIFLVPSRSDITRVARAGDQGLRLRKTARPSLKP